MVVLLVLIQLYNQFFLLVFTVIKVVSPITFGEVLLVVELLLSLLSELSDLEVVELAELD